jgi:multicomponent Na+:H+ antiporter subunit A
VLPLLVAAPFLAAALTPLLGRRLGRATASLNASILLLVSVALALRVPQVLDGAVQTWRWEWLPDGLLSLSLRVDALALLFALVVSVVGVLVLGYAARYFGPDDPAAVRTVALLTLFAGAMLGLVLADDVLALFVFWELTSITSFFLIGGDGKGKQGALRALLVTAVGGLALLAAMVLLSLVVGDGSLATITASATAVQASPLLTPIIALVLLAAFTKSAQFPFHFWLPGAMVAPTPVSTYLHAATMVKAGIYLLLRLAPAFSGVALWHVVLVLVGGATAVLGAWVAFPQRDLKRLMAYSTVSQLGLLTALIGLGTPLALGIAALHVGAHALFKAALFMTVGVVDHETGTRDLDRLGGLWRALPLTAVAGTLAAASMAGLPPLLGFLTKEEALAAFAKGVPTVPWLGPVGLGLIVVASIGTFAYSGRYVLGTFFGPVRTAAHRAPFGFEAPALLLALIGLAAGPLGRLLTPPLEILGTQLGGASPGVKLALWHGVTVPLLLTIGIVVLGSLALTGRSALERAGSRLPHPSCERAFDTIYDVLIALGGRIRRTATSPAPAAYLLPVVGTLLVVLAGAAVLVPSTGMPATSPMIDWVAVLLVAAGIAGMLQTTSRIGAVAALGLVGFLIAAWFALHGAPDLALTQLLVESLTVALVIVVFRRLPDTFARGGRPRRAGAAVLAVLVGAGAGTLTWLATGRRDRSAIGSRFLADAEELTGGDNVVNTILVDFRALDTLGEIGVLAIAAAGIFAIVRRPVSRPLAPPSDVRLTVGVIDSAILRVANDTLAPVLLLVAVWLLLRGHDAVGGGFIGGLAAGAAIVLLYLTRGHRRLWQSRWTRTFPLVGTGLTIAVAYGLSGLATSGSFLAGGKWRLPGGIELAHSLVFDVGVFLVVVGLVVSILRHLGQGFGEDDPVESRGGRPSASEGGRE